MKIFLSQGLVSLSVLDTPRVFATLFSQGRQLLLISVCFLAHQDLPEKGSTL